MQGQQLKIKKYTSQSANTKCIPLGSVVAKICILSGLRQIISLTFLPKTLLLTAQSAKFKKLCHINLPTNGTSN